MLCRPPRPRFSRPQCSYAPRPRYDGYQEDFPTHPSRRGSGFAPPYRGRPAGVPDYPPRPRLSPRLRPGLPPPSLSSQPPPRQFPQAQPHTRHQQHDSSYDYYTDAYRRNESEYGEPPRKFFDPYNQDNEEDWDSYQTTQTNELTLVSNMSAPPVPKGVEYGSWTPASSEPIVKNKELDDWVPASKKTRVFDEEMIEEEQDYITPGEYEKWRKSKGVGLKGGVGVKRKLGKALKGVFTATGKHPIAALNEKIPTCEFAEEGRERDDELKFWKLTASVKFSGYKFLGYGVTIKIAKAEAAIKALTFLDVEGLHEMQDHIPSEQYLHKQRIMESVMQEAQEEAKVEEPWYIKIDDENDLNIPVFRPKELPNPDTHPVMFLKQWFGPDIQTEFQIENPGFRPEIFSCTVIVQGMGFQGTGPSKKEAQKMTAALTLRKLEENPPPIDNRKLHFRGKKNKSKNKKPKLISGVADFPSLPNKPAMPTQMPTVDAVPVTPEPISSSTVSSIVLETLAAAKNNTATSVTSTKAITAPTSSIAGPKKILTRPQASSLTSTTNKMSTVISKPTPSRNNPAVWREKPKPAVVTKTTPAASSYSTNYQTNAGNYQTNSGSNSYYSSSWSSPSYNNSNYSNSYSNTNSYNNTNTNSYNNANSYSNNHYNYSDAYQGYSAVGQQQQPQGYQGYGYQAQYPQAHYPPLPSYNQPPPPPPPS